MTTIPKNMLMTEIFEQYNNLSARDKRAVTAKLSSADKLRLKRYVAAQKNAQDLAGEAGAPIEGDIDATSTRLSVWLRDKAALKIKNAESFEQQSPCVAAIRGALDDCGAGE